MSEEKTLDDEALEKVSGGQGGSPNVNEIYVFADRNCFHCSHYEVDCPYGGHKEAIQELWGDRFANCPHKEA